MASPAARSRIVLYYDIVSPWSFVAFRTLRAYARLWEKEADLELCPFNLVCTSGTCVIGALC